MSTGASALRDMPRSRLTTDQRSVANSCSTITSMARPMVRAAGHRIELASVTKPITASTGLASAISRAAAPSAAMTLPA